MNGTRQRLHRRGRRLGGPYPGNDTRQGRVDGTRHRQPCVGAGLTPRALAPPTAHSSQGVAGAAPPFSRQSPGPGAEQSPAPTDKTVPLRNQRRPLSMLPRVYEQKPAPATPPTGKAGHAGPALRGNRCRHDDTVGAIHESPVTRRQLPPGMGEWQHETRRRPNFLSPTVTISPQSRLT